VSDGAREAAGYALATLVLAGAGVALFGGDREVLAGVMAAWVLQAAAFVPLWGALSAGRPAARAWVGGLLLRAGGLIVTAALALGGRAGSDLPLSYGLAMTVLLICEAGWLALRAGSPSSFERSSAGSGPGEDPIDRTRSTG
jgi:hypothetical protein